MKESVCHGAIMFSEPLNGVWPIQAEGYILGRKFFFTAKEGKWVVGIHGDGDTTKQKVHSFEGEYLYHPESRRDVTHLECLGFIVKVATMWQEKYI